MIALQDFIHLKNIGQYMFFLLFIYKLLFAKCVDLNPNSLTKELEDLSAVEKYVMPDDDYDKLPSSKKKNYNTFKRHFQKI